MQHARSAQRLHVGAAARQQGRGDDGGAPAARLPARGEPRPMYAYETEDEQGNAKMLLLNTEDWELVPVLDTEDLLADLDKIALEPELPIEGGAGGAGGEQLPVEVPATRLILDERELELIGEGLPIINGVGVCRMPACWILLSKRWGVGILNPAVERAGDVCADWRARERRHACNGHA